VEIGLRLLAGRARANSGDLSDERVMLADYTQDHHNYRELVACEVKKRTSPGELGESWVNEAPPLCHWHLWSLASMVTGIGARG
jgi:hypothetical protein